MMATNESTMAAISGPIQRLILPTIFFRSGMVERLCVHLPLMSSRMDVHRYPQVSDQRQMVRRELSRRRLDRLDAVGLNPRRYEHVVDAKARPSRRERRVVPRWRD